MSNFLKIAILSNDGVCDRALMIDSLKTAMDQHDAKQNTAHDDVEQAFLGYMARNVDLNVFSTGTLITRAHELASAKIRANGGDDKAVDAALTQLKVTVPAFLKSRPDQFCVARGRSGVTVRYVDGETNADGSQRYRTDDKSWAEVTAPPAPKDAKDAPAADAAPASK